MHHTLRQHSDLSQAGIPLCEPRQQAGAWVLHATQPKLPSYPSDPKNDEFAEETGAKTTESHQTKEKKNHFFQAQLTFCMLQKQEDQIQ